MSDRFFTQKTCSRCHKELTSRIMSMMNEDVLCPECSEAERDHPDYKQAAEEEGKQVSQGNYNYRGLHAGKQYPFDRRGNDD